MRPMQMKHSANPVPRNTAPSPQSNVGGYQPRSQWSQPSPVNQFGQTGHFAQPRPPVPSNSQVFFEFFSTKQNKLSNG